MSRPSGHRLRLATGAAALLAVLAACGSDRDALTAPPFADNTAPATETSPAPAVIESVAMVGDSITFGAYGALEDRFASIGLDDVTIDAVGGRRMTLDGLTTDSGVDAVSRLRADRPDLWVIALGTNDIVNYSAGEYGPAILELLGTIPGEAPVVWVDTYLAEHETASAHFNQELRTILDARGRATVVDWASAADDDGVLTDDGIHPSDDGLDQFSDMVTDAVDDWTS